MSESLSEPSARECGAAHGSHRSTGENRLRMRKSELKDKTVAELRELARSSGLRGYSGLRKSELVELL